jgi:hypothetical protein
MITMFEGYSVHEEVNKFLAQRGYDVWDVQIQFVSRTSADPNQYGDVIEDTVAYVTHPAD